MLFNSLNFFYFLIIVFAIYWLLYYFLDDKKNIIYTQNILILFSSFYFYSCWSFKFLFLLFFVILFGFFIGLILKKYEERISLSKNILRFSVFVHIFILFIFKYYNFFVEEFISVFNLNFNSFYKIILPVGISFYIFHGVSYIVDIYNKKVLPTKNIIFYGNFISYFPLLVSGPIERATNLFPQLSSFKLFSYKNIKDGIVLIIWGFFKKIVVADNMSNFADFTFNLENDVFGLYTVLGILFFSIQIYCDFSGYTDIAIGVSKLFGMKLINNFNFPYFSKNIKEFWTKWHISLTSFFRDYLYIPLGGSRVNNYVRVRNVFFVFIVSGFWHGASWTFIIWGLIHFIFYIPYLITRFKNTIDEFEKRIGLINYFLTFSIVSFGWVFFRASTFSDALILLKRVFEDSTYFGYDFLIYDVLILIIFLLFEYKAYRNKNFLINAMPFLLVLIAFMRVTSSNTFIYFQF